MFIAAKAAKSSVKKWFDIRPVGATSGTSLCEGFCFCGSGESEALQSGRENKTSPTLVGRGHLGNANAGWIRPRPTKEGRDNPGRATFLNRTSQ
jgi:hypothetical protein